MVAADADTGVRASGGEILAAVLLEAPPSGMLPTAMSGNDASGRHLSGADNKPSRSISSARTRSMPGSDGRDGGGDIGGGGIGGIAATIAAPAAARLSPVIGIIRGAGKTGIVL